MAFFPMLGIILAGTILPCGVELTLERFLKNTEPWQSLLPFTPTILYGISGPINILILCLLTRRLIKKRSLSYFCFRRIPFADVALCILIGVMMAFLVLSVAGLSFVKNGFPELQSLIRYTVTGNLFLLIYITAINTIYQEIWLRGFIFNQLRGVLPFILALAGQAAFYAIISAITGRIIGLYVFPGACLFGIIYYAGKSIWSSIATQFCCTMTLVLCSQTGFSELFTTRSASFILILSILAAVILITTLYRNNQKQGQANTVSF